ncbi:hypothetical protein RJ640_019295 [Escallonia rubra]|uniref:Integrase catalytic domain-containing protein n=1 Tax=Escallonia rubra TaxID=112253 RepID=A0AA88UI33_9ASTE|nr:hypothetical protein RJ640_019295 [Escallonia rubra]
MVSSNERTYADLCLSDILDDNSKVWYVDSGASIHCTPHRDCFSDYGHVTVGNGYRCSIVGKGKVKIKLSNGGTLLLNDVRHIPELQKNLISVADWIVKAILWHLVKNSGRLGHLSESGMRILHSKNSLPGMKNIQLDFCEGCVYGKQKRVSFRKDGKERKIERLELVHTDVCRPTTVKSLGGNFYFVSFIDEASRKTWIYAIKQKSDVYHTFKKWKALVENEIGNKVKCLKSDNGGEYCDGGFQEYCSNNGIRLIRTVKRTPQENGLAERMNRTIMERARSPASALNGGIPEEEWSGKPDYEHNKIIRSRDVIFDESQLYKHRLQEHEIGKEGNEYMELDEPEDGQIPRIESPEVLDETTDTEIGAGDQQQVSETLNLRRSSQVRKAPDRLCLPLDYILYTNSGEPECYQEAIQDESRLQWEQAMKDEMASLEQNQTWDLVKLSAGVQGA